jgi:alkanesulfonate monooxygenase SsuD/methylene tetrahydromethanopterin reductase-like flavin-dependent oxidoreductase (luciferase family)
MQFGVFDHMDRSAVPLDRFYADRLRLAEEYDTCGFYGYHVAEHHATPLGVAPSPGVWLAAVAQRTKQLRFGPLVYLLPLYHPLKLLEEICMLDQMSGGRLMLGVGRGISPIELRYYGIDPDAAPAMYAEDVAPHRTRSIRECLAQFVIERGEERRSGDGDVSRLDFIGCQSQSQRAARTSTG